MSPEDPRRFALRRYGCRVRVHLAVGEQHRKAFEAAGRKPPPPLPMLGLIDTGADNVAVKRGTLASLGVKAVEQIEVNVAQGKPSVWPAYAGRLIFAEAVVIPCLVAEALNPELPFDCILGRDILAFGEFMWDGRTGRCSLKLNDRDIAVETP